MYFVISNDMLVGMACMYRQNPEKANDMVVGLHVPKKF